MDTSLHLHVDDPDAITAALRRHDLTDSGDGPLVAVLDAPVTPGQVATVLAAWIAAARDAAARDVDIVTVLDDSYLDGDDVGRLSVGHGLVSAARAYSFEGQRTDRRANVVVGASTASSTLSTAAWLLTQPAVSGHVLLTGTQLHGRQRP